MIKNIKKILISIIAVFSFAFILNVSTVKAAGEYATISGGGTINEDGSVSVTVNITNNDGLWGAEGTLSYDSSVIEYSGSASGATVNGGNGQITFVQDYDGVSKAGSIMPKSLFVKKLKQGRNRIMCDFILSVVFRLPFLVYTNFLHHQNTLNHQTFLPIIYLRLIIPYRQTKMIYQRRPKRK